MLKYKDEEIDLTCNKKTNEKTLVYLGMMDENGGMAIHHTKPPKNFQILQQRAQCKFIKVDYKNLSQDVSQIVRCDW